MLRHLTLLSAYVLWGSLAAQSYTSYFTGSTQDVQPDPLGGVCMMGGASEFDPAMEWFLARASGGDVLVLRASGSDGYNDYMYSDLGGINSVETIVFNNASASQEAYVQERITKAEAIWFAGGDQWDYVSYWRDTPVMTLVNAAIADRNIAIGGTSAGMAILGGCYFSAENGSVTSSTALADPYDPLVTVDCAPFLQVPFMDHVITDTHYDNPDRRGRHFTFLARMVTDQGMDARGIACNEYVAVCIAPDGIAHVYGEYPEYQEFAYFLQVNCLQPNAPETCMADSPLTWERDGAAVKVYKVPGVPDGANWIDLNDWEDGSGGEWLHWTATDGAFSEEPGTANACGTVQVDAVEAERTDLHRLADGRFAIGPVGPDADLHVFASDGREVAAAIQHEADRYMLDLTDVAVGVFLIRLMDQGKLKTWKVAVPQP